MFNILKGFKGILNQKNYLGLMSNSLPDTDIFNNKSYLSLLDLSLYTTKAINKRAEKVGEIEFVLKDKKGEIVENNPLIDLLYKPNNIFSSSQFWGLYQTFYDVFGEVYIYLETSSALYESKKIKAMHLINPETIKPIFNESGEIEKYEKMIKGKAHEYTKEEIIYIHNPDPANILRGKSLLKVGINAIATENQIGTYHSRILKNGGKIEGIFKFKTGMLSEDQLSRIKEGYQKEYSTAKKSGTPLFLGGDADYINIGLSPQELSFLEAKKTTLEDICILTGTPKSILGSTEDVKFDNADADIKIFLKETINPLLKVLTVSLDNKLFPDDLNLTYIDPTPENAELKLKETENGIKNYWLTPNEARERHGLDPITGGENLLIPFSLLPASSKEEEKEEKGSKKKKEIAEEKTHPLEDENFRKVYFDIRMKMLDRDEESFLRELNKYFDFQESELIKKIEGKKTFRKKDLIDESFNFDSQIIIGKNYLLPVIKTLLLKYGSDAVEFSGSSFDFNLSSEITNWLDQKSEIFLERINETSFNKLKEEFAESLSLNESREKLVKRIGNVYDDIKTSRSPKIARTEVHNVSQYATIQGYRQGGLQYKIWVSVGDKYTRDTHSLMDGEKRPLDRPFSNGLMYPGDGVGSAEEVINCRCVI